MAGNVAGEPRASPGVCPARTARAEADTLQSIIRGLKAGRRRPRKALCRKLPSGPLARFQVLRSKFHRLFFVPGNRDLALNASEAEDFGTARKQLVS